MLKNSLLNNKKNGIIRYNYTQVAYAFEQYIKIKEINICRSY